MQVLKDLIADFFTLDDWNSETVKVALAAIAGVAAILGGTYLIAVIGKWGMEAGVFPLRIFG